MRVKLYTILFFLTSTIIVKGQAFLAGQALPYYFDIIPDTMLTYSYGMYGSSMSYYFDMNGDTQMDFELRAYSSSGLGANSQSISINVLNTNSFVLYAKTDSAYNNYLGNWMKADVPKSLNPGDTINSNHAVWRGTQYLMDNDYCCGTTLAFHDWIDSTDQYIGIKHLGSADTVYGWIRVNCPVGNQCFVKDFSISKFFVNIPEIAHSPMVIYPNPTSGFFYVKNVLQRVNLSTVSVTDIYGKEINCNFQITGNDLKFLFPEGAASGCYFIHLPSQSCVSTLKIFKD